LISYPEEKDASPPFIPPLKIISKNFKLDKKKIEA